MKKTTLLSLPTEVRAQIIDLVISHREKTPDLTTVDRDRKQLADYNGRGWWIGNGILYQTDTAAYETNTKSLLLTSRHLRADTLAQLALYKGRVNYEIDIICDHDRNLLPTWTLLPMVTNRIDTLSATLRVFRSNSNTGVWLVGNAGPARLSFWLYNMLERTLQVGASGPRSTVSKVQRWPVTVNRLEIDIQPTADTATHCTLTPTCPTLQRDVFERPAIFAYGTDTIYVRHPERVHQFVCSYLTALLTMSYPVREFGAVLYSNIGAISVSVGGALRKEYELGAMLVGSAEDGPRLANRMEMDEARLEPWRRKAMADRRANGLPTVELNAA